MKGITSKKQLEISKVLLFVIVLYIGFICYSYLPMREFKSTVMSQLNNLPKLDDFTFYSGVVPAKEPQFAKEEQGMVPQPSEKVPRIESQYQRVKLLCWIMTGPDNYYTKVGLFKF